MKRRMLLGTAAAGLLNACAGPQLADFAGATPAFDLRRYFDGTVEAWGLFTDRGGKVVKRFTVVMQCSWRGDEGVLDEAFSYSDGTQQRRVWHLRQLPDGHYTGRADDVIGEAAGRQQGNAFRWNYTLSLPVDGRLLEVQMDDWMYLMSERVLLNKAAMSKFGVHLGDVTLSFTKR